MFWFAVAAIAGGALVAAALSDDSSSSSCSKTYTSTGRKTISEDSVKRKRDYIQGVIKETKDVLNSRYGAEVRISENGDYDVLCYGDGYERLSVMEEEILKELNKLQIIEL